MLKKLLAAAAIPLVVSTAAAQSQAPSPTNEARLLWKSIIGNLNQAADELSETMYAYRPTPDVRTVGEMFAHVAGSQKMYCAMALGEKVPGEGDVEKTAKTKAAIVAALKESNMYCERAYSQPDENLKAPVEIFGTTHPRFYALIANAFIDAMNARFGTTLKHTNVVRIAANDFFVGNRFQPAGEAPFGLISNDDDPVDDALSTIEDRIDHVIDDFTDHFENLF